MEKLFLRFVARARLATDKFAHVGIGAMAGLVPAFFLLPAYSPPLVALLVGLLIEYVQARYHLGEPDPFDVAATTLGGFLIGAAMVLSHAHVSP